MTKGKTYAIEEAMSGNWIERWSDFSSLKKARGFARKMDSQSHGRLRIVCVTRKPCVDGEIGSGSKK